jgi:hypothetical protein
VFFVHSTHCCVTVLQIRMPPPQSVAERHPTHVPTDPLVSQIGAPPGHAVLVVHAA